MLLKLGLYVHAKGWQILLLGSVIVCSYIYIYICVCEYAKTTHIYIYICSTCIGTLAFGYNSGPHGSPCIRDH